MTTATRPLPEGLFFDEIISTNEVAGFCEVSIDRHFIELQCDPYEGVIQLGIQAAKEVYDSLGRAIKFAEEQRLEAGKQREREL